MIRTRAYLLVPALLLAALTATAQRRLTSNTALQPELQAELALQNNDYLLVGVSALNVNGAGTTFSGGQLRLGYEHFWSEQWSGGATLRLLRQYGQGYGDFLGQPGNIVPGVFVRHSGKISSFNFGQRLGVEYGISTVDVLSIIERNNRASARLRLDVDRIFPLGETVALRPRVAYEAAAYLRFQRDENQVKERTIDFGVLRAEVGVRLSPHVDVTPWVASQTAYTVFVAQYDAQGRQVSGGRTNLVTPVVGLDARFTLFSGDAAQERRQLPTQH
ncbi:hypothetical protein [Hymenobacter wooponensis]|uniref:DUF481 domain-containing protein n=1 Tax=Hymenobacter wooponensis TaxID=1525360 RepID=A0A4Z0MPF3_9BACT|nr:hypothetical protein [Hymenobacter wooponensis]TGD81320.1 hypothetical protein EU557_07070 [Hymenobacter wooponensis]